MRERAFTSAHAGQATCTLWLHDELDLTKRIEMKLNLQIRTTALMVVTASAMIATAAAQQDRSELPERFSAFAISLGGPRQPSGTATVDIVINRWSTDAERERLLEALKKNQDALLDTLRDLPPVGSIRTPGNLAYDLHYANQGTGEEGERRIFLATDRPIGFWEASRRPRSSR